MSDSRSTERPADAHPAPHPDPAHVAALGDPTHPIRAATEAGGIGVWVWTPGSDVIAWQNDQPYEIFGLPRDATPVTAARFIGDFLHPDDVPSFRAALEAAIERNDGFRFEGRIRHGIDGSLRWVQMTGRPKAPPAGGKHADAGRPEVIGIATDITARKRIESELEETRRRLDATLLDAEVATWRWDVPHDRAAGEPPVARATPAPSATASANPFARYIEGVHPADRERVAARVRDALEGDGLYEATYRVAREEGGVRHVIARGRLERDAQGAPLSLRGVIVDVTREREAEDRLRSSEERYRTLFDSMDEGVCLVEIIVDAAERPVDYRFLETNPAFARQTGLDHPVGRTARELLPRLEDHWIETYGRIARTRRAERFQSGSPAMGRWFDVYAAPVGEPGRRQVVILFTDITARKRAEDELRTAAAELLAANRRKTEFIATLAHELRNPLAPLRNGLQLMRLAASEPVVVGKARDMMERQLDHLVRLVNDLLDIARITRGQVELRPERVSVGAIVASAVETTLPAIEAMKHRLSVSVPEAPLVLDADPTRLAQVVANLLSNAAKYTPEGGRIEVVARREGDEAVIAVEDTGVGIPPESLEEVFAMFNQVERNTKRAQGGLGIGLSLVRQLTELHGGTVSAWSAGPGCGSTFVLRLPLAPELPSLETADIAPAALPASDAGAATAAAPPAPGLPAEPGPRLRVLIVDDNRDAAESLSLLVQLRGHATVVAHDGRRGLEAARALRPDLVFLDIGMPDMDGYAVARAIRAVDGMRNTPVVALSGWGAPEDLRRSRAAGFDEHLTKPALLQAVDRVLANLDSLRWSQARQPSRGR